MKEAIFHFPTDGKPCECEQIKSGHIHETYLITTMVTAGSPTE